MPHGHHDFDDDDYPWKPWKDLNPGHLKQAIEDEFANAEPGTYFALAVKVENPISGYVVIKVPTGG